MTIESTLIEAPNAVSRLVRAAVTAVVIVGGFTWLIDPIELDAARIATCITSSTATTTRH